jgi:hypothetical protein
MVTGQYGAPKARRFASPALLLAKWTAAAEQTNRARPSAQLMLAIGLCAF